MDYLKELKHNKSLKLLTGEIVAVYELGEIKSSDVFDEWANHFRQCYCEDKMLAELVDGTPYTKHDYIEKKKFPSLSSLGSATRTGDFSELLVSDFLEFLFGYIVPKDRYSHKFNPDMSSPGVDVMGLKVVDENCTIKDEMVIFEVKGKKKEPLSDNRLQKAIDDSHSDYLRNAENLDAIRQRAIERNDNDTKNLVKRFQNKVKYPYTVKYGAAAVLDNTLYTDADVLAVNAKPPVDWLIVIKRDKLENLINKLYERAADLA